LTFARGGLQFVIVDWLNPVLYPIDERRLTQLTASICLEISHIRGRIDTDRGLGTLGGDHSLGTRESIALTIGHVQRDIERRPHLLARIRATRVLPDPIHEIKTKCPINHRSRAPEVILGKHLHGAALAVRREVGVCAESRDRRWQTCLRRRAREARHRNEQCHEKNGIGRCQHSDDAFLPRFHGQSVAYIH